MKYFNHDANEWEVYTFKNNAQEMKYVYYDLKHADVVKEQKSNHVESPAFNNKDSKRCFPNLTEFNRIGHFYVDFKANITTSKK